MGFPQCLEMPLVGENANGRSVHVIIAEGSGRDGEIEDLKELRELEEPCPQSAI